MRNDLCDFNDAYIVLTGKISAVNSTLPQNLPDGANYSRKLSLKNSSPFFNGILEINNQLIEDAQDLDAVMPIYNLFYHLPLFTLLKQPDLFGIIIQILQVQDILVAMKEQGCFTQ